MHTREPALLVRSVAGTIIGWNEQAERTFGYSAGEVLGKKADAIVSGRNAPDDEPLGECVCLTKDGRALPVVSRRSLITDGAEAVVAVCEVLTLIGAAEEPQVLHEELAAARRVRQEQARRIDQQVQLMRVIDSSPGVTLSYRVDAEGRTHFALVSSAAYALYGFTAEEIERDPSLILSRVPPEDMHRGSAIHDVSAEALQPLQGEFRYLHPSGETKWLEARSLPSREPDGSIVWNGVVVDVTKRKLAEAKLSEAQTQLEGALSAGALGAWQWDLERQQYWGNREMRSLWEVPEDAPEWFGRSLARAVIHPDDQARVEAEVVRMHLPHDRNSPDGRFENEFRMVRSDGSIRWIASRTRRAEGGKRLLGVHVDVTEQKLAAEAALRLHKLEALGTLAGGIAHDFNNILFAISGYAALALGAIPEDSRARAHLAQIASAATRATDLVRQILVFSRPEEQERERVELANILHDALTLVRATTPALIELDSELDPATPPVVADPSRLVQVIVNLCTNAAQAIGKERAGRIAVRTEPYRVDETATPQQQLKHGPYARLSVQDDGCGMDEATRARIFDPFFTTKQPGQGAGLGLSVVHGIVNALGGLVDVRSSPGQGSTFELYIPAADAFEPPQGEADSKQASKGQRIMFVDDESMLVALGESMLQILGYDAAAFQDPASALEAFRAAPDSFAAVITDLSMPVMSGFKLARALLSIRGDIPILIMSGYIGAEERSVGQQLGVRELVLKPVSMDRLGELLARLR